MSRWTGIDEFVAVAVSGSFVRGAKALGASPTHVSRAIKMLEFRVQAQLLVRTTRTVRLTDTGRIFLDRCQRILEERDDAIAMINEQGEPQGELRLTCSNAMGERFIAPILRRFAIEHPRLTVSIELTNRLVDLVGEGYDLAIRTGELADPRLIGTHVASRQFLTCAAPDYLDRVGSPANIDSLDQHEAVIGTSPTWSFNMAGRKILYRPHGRFRCNNGSAVVDACLAGMGICQLPEFYVVPHLKAGRLRPVLDELRPRPEPIWAVYPQRRHLLPKISRAIDYIRMELAAGMAIPNL
jgi:DNA-binding transcriptional LysR family regulator